MCCASVNCRYYSILEIFIRSRDNKIMGTFRIYRLSFSFKELGQLWQLSWKEEICIFHLIYEPKKSNEYFKHGEIYNIVNLNGVLWRQNNVYLKELNILWKFIFNDKKWQKITYFHTYNIIQNLAMLKILIGYFCFIYQMKDTYLLFSC